MPGIEGSVDINFRYIPPRPGAAQIETLYLSDPALTLTAGTTLLMWIGEQITAQGVGNGISLIIFAGIVAALPKNIATIF